MASAGVTDVITYGDINVFEPRYHPSLFETWRGRTYPNSDGLDQNIYWIFVSNVCVKYDHQNNSLRWDCPMARTHKKYYKTDASVFIT